MTDTVVLEIRDGVAVVTLNQPATANALGMDMGRDLLEVALRVEGDPGVRAVVVTGAGKHFCFGGDLTGMLAQGEAVGGYLNELTTRIHAAISCFTRMRAPVVAAVNGTAAGGGVGLVCMADLAIAGRGSRFRLAYAGVGLAPDCATSFLLPRIVGRRRALELFLTNRLLGADEALEWGLVNRVVDDEQVLPAALELESYATVKRLVDAADPGLESQMALEGRTMAAQCRHPHGREGVAAFLAKRKPIYE